MKMNKYVLIAFMAVITLVVVTQEPVTAVQQTPVSLLNDSSGPSSIMRNTPRAWPQRIRIPAIGVSAPLVVLGLNKDHSLQVPVNAYSAGWFSGAPRPGKLGPAVIAAHVHWNGVDGAFANIDRLIASDRIVVVNTDGSHSVFEVTKVASYKKNQFPSALVYGNIDFAGLRLITCDGFDRKTHRYLDNLVVFARIAIP